MKKIKPQLCRVLSNRKLDRQGLYFRLRIENFLSPRKILPGQFVHIKVAEGLDPFFRRAFSIAARDSDIIDVIYKIVGRGTTLMGDLTKGDTIDVIGPLGNAFTKPPGKKDIVIAAGGVGLPPLLYFTRHLVETGYPADRIHFFYGGRTKADLIETSAIKTLGVSYHPCTDDGSIGYHGFVTGAIEAKLAELPPEKTRIYGCGPEPMLAALQSLALNHQVAGELSLEAPMPCGVGVCLGCIKSSLKEPGKYIRVCHDGPVFAIGEVKL